MINQNHVKRSLHLRNSIAGRLQVSNIRTVVHFVNTVSNWYLLS